MTEQQTITVLARSQTWSGWHKAHYKSWDLEVKLFMQWEDIVEKMTIDSRCYSSSEKMVILSKYNLQEVFQHQIRFITELSWDELCGTLILIGCLRILFKVSSPEISALVWMGCPQDWMQSSFHHKVSVFASRRLFSKLAILSFMASFFMLMAPQSCLNFPTSSSLSCMNCWDSLPHSI